MNMLKVKVSIAKIFNKKLYFKYKAIIERSKDAESSSPKIILISHVSDDSGAVILLLEMIKELYRRNFNILLLTRNYGPLIEKASDYACIEVFSNNKNFKKSIKRAYNLGFRNVISNTTVNGDLIPILKNESFNVISLVHELPLTIKKLGIEKNAKLLARHSDFIVFPSQYVMDKFKTISPIRSKCLIKAQGVNLTDGFEINRNDAKNKIYQIFSISQSSQLVLGVGAGDMRKGYDIFLDLAAKCTYNNIKFIWVGKYRKDIYDKKIHYHGLSKFNNLYQVGFISDIELLSSFYAASDVFVLTSREDPFPSVVLQAFNAKTPVVGFKDAGGFQDIVKTGFSGYLVDYEDVDNMLKTIEFLINNNDHREKMGNNAKKIANSYSFSEYIDYLLKLFQKCEVRGEK
ncbi:MAG: glycosyltransferase family 4 protein [Eubacteriales bacterium]